MQIVKKNDEVIVITGKDKGKHGKVIRVVTKSNRVFVQGINLVKKHVKSDPQSGKGGGIETREASIRLDNVALWNPMTKKADKVGFKVLEDGRKVRYFRSNNELVDTAI
jgi:large subunit ribosomal protein L24